MGPTPRPGEDRRTPSERVETPADRAERDGEEDLSLHRWTDAELKQRAKDLGITDADDLARPTLIKRLSETH